MEICINKTRGYWRGNSRYCTGGEKIYLFQTPEGDWHGYRKYIDYRGTNWFSREDLNEPEIKKYLNIWRENRKEEYIDLSEWWEIKEEEE